MDICYDSAVTYVFAEQSVTKAQILYVACEDNLLILEGMLKEIWVGEVVVHTEFRPVPLVEPKCPSGLVRVMAGLWGSSKAQ